MDVDPLIVLSFPTGQALYDWAVQNDVLDNYFVQERLCQLSFRIPVENQILPAQPSLSTAVNQQNDGFTPPGSPESHASGDSWSTDTSEQFDIQKIKDDVQGAARGGKTYECPKRCGAKFKSYTALSEHRASCPKRQQEGPSTGPVAGPSAEPVAGPSTDDSSQLDPPCAEDSYVCKVRL